MLVVCVLLILLCLFVLASLSLQQSMGLPQNVDVSDKTLSEARGYGYGYNPAVATYPVLPLFEPLVMLSAIAFIAFLIQTFHVFYLSNRYVGSPTTQSTSLLGGVVDSLVPTRHRILNSVDDRLEDLLTAIHLCKLTAEKKWRRKSGITTEVTRTRSKVLK